MPLLPGVSCLDLSPKTGHPSTCDNQMPAAVLPACCSAALLIAMTLGLIGRDMFGNVDSEFGSSTIQGDTSNALRGWLRSFILQYHEDTQWTRRLADLISPKRRQSRAVWSRMPQDATGKRAVERSNCATSIPQSARTTRKSAE